MWLFLSMILCKGCPVSKWRIPTIRWLMWCASTRWEDLTMWPLGSKTDVSTYTLPTGEEPSPVWFCKAGISSCGPSFFKQVCPKSRRGPRRWVMRRICNSEVPTSSKWSLAYDWRHNNGGIAPCRPMKWCSHCWASSPGYLVLMLWLMKKHLPHQVPKCYKFEEVGWCESLVMT
jgi:hypothetical protein